MLRTGRRRWADWVACASYLLLSVLLLAVTVAGCGDGDNGAAGGGGGGGGGGGNGVTVDETDRHASVAAIEDRYGEIVGEAFGRSLVDLQDADVRLEMMQAMAEHLEADPLLTAVTVDEVGQTVGAIYLDGTSLSVLFNRLGEFPPVDDEPAPRRTRAIDGAPGGPDAWVVRNLGSFYPGGDDEAIEAMLDEAGYNARRLPGTLPELLAMPDLSVLYWESHGGSVPAPIPGTNPLQTKLVYGIWTGTVVDRQAAEFATYGAMARNEQKLAYMVGHSDKGADGKPTVETRWGILPNFVTDHFKFDDNALFVNDCCFGSHPDVTAFPVAAFAAGLSVYAGWDNPSNNNDQSLFFFDRCLGANEFRPTARAHRPFGWQEVYAKMAELELNLSPAGGCHPLAAIFGHKCLEATLRFSTNPTQSDHLKVLRPSIRQMVVLGDAGGAAEEDLQLFGDFGHDPRTIAGYDGKVEVGHTELNVTDWRPDRITCDLPNVGPGSAGLVTVTVNDIESNPVTLTEWTGTMRFLHRPGLGNLVAIANVDVRFRADLHQYRERLDGAILDQQQRYYGVPDPEVGRIGASGSFSDGGASQTWSGNNPLLLPARQLVDQYILGAGGGVAPVASRQIAAQTAVVAGELDGGADQAELCLYVNGQFTITIQPGGISSPGALILPVVQPLVDRFQGLAGCVELTLRDDFVIPGGERTRNDGLTTWELRWSDLLPRFAPNDDLPT